MNTKEEVLEMVRLTVVSIIKRKIELVIKCIDDSTFQYTSGSVNGALEVLRDLERRLQ